MGKLLWTPTEEHIKQTNMYRFMVAVEEQYGQKFADYAALYQWSVESIPDFWASMWEFADIKASKPYDQVVDDVSKLWYFLTQPVGCTVE